MLAVKEEKHGSKSGVLSQPTAPASSLSEPALAKEEPAITLARELLASHQANTAAFLEHYHEMLLQQRDIINIFRELLIPSVKLTEDEEDGPKRDLSGKLIRE